MADFTVTVKREYLKGLTVPPSYRAIMYDSRGRVRSRGVAHAKARDAENDAFIFMRNMPY